MSVDVSSRSHNNVFGAGGTIVAISPDSEYLLLSNGNRPTGIAYFNLSNGTTSATDDGNNQFFDLHARQPIQ